MPDEEINPLAAPPTPFLPTRTVPVFRVQKTPWREWLMSGGAAQITVVTPVTQAAAAVLTISGQIYLDASVPQYPATITVQLSQRGVVKGTNAVVPGMTGAYTTTFPANTLVPGTGSNACVATVSSTMPVSSTVSPPFPVT